METNILISDVSFGAKQTKEKKSVFTDWFFFVSRKAVSGRKIFPPVTEELFWPFVLC